MNLQWYPGHMTKARRTMEENLKLVDVIVEIRDARIPRASANPDLKNMGQGKKRLLVLNKADLADPMVTAAWEEHFRALDYEPLSLDSRKKNESGKIRRQLELWAAEKSEKDALRGIKNRPIRVMVAGIPNVGKSTLINSLAGRASTKTGDRPGVTRGIQWIRLSRSMELMDTPGILWPKFGDRHLAGPDGSHQRGYPPAGRAGRARDRVFAEQLSGRPKGKIRDRSRSAASLSGRTGPEAGLSEKRIRTGSRSGGQTFSERLAGRKTGAPLPGEALTIRGTA